MDLYPTTLPPGLPLDSSLSSALDKAGLTKDGLSQLASGIREVRRYYARRPRVTSKAAEGARLVRDMEQDTSVDPEILALAQWEVFQLEQEACVTEDRELDLWSSELDLERAAGQYDRHYEDLREERRTLIISRCRNVHKAAESRAYIGEFRTVQGGSLFQPDTARDFCRKYLDVRDRKVQQEDDDCVAALGFDGVVDGDEDSETEKNSEDEHGALWDAEMLSEKTKAVLDNEACNGDRKEKKNKPLNPFAHYCQVTNRWFDFPKVMTAHLVPKCVLFEAQEFAIFREGRDVLKSPKNCLLMHESIKEMMDAHHLIIIPVDPTEKPITRWKLVILEQTLFEQELQIDPSTVMRWSAFHNKELTFDGRYRPDAGYAYFRYVLALMNWKDLRREGWTRLLAEYNKHPPFASPKQYLRSEFLLALVGFNGFTDSPVVKEWVLQNTLATNEDIEQWAKSDHYPDDKIIAAQVIGELYMQMCYTLASRDCLYLKGYRQDN